MEHSKNWKLLERTPVGGRRRSIGVANQKGGVAKTTTAVNLGAALGLRGHRILVVDVDPQGNASTGLGLARDRIEGSTYEVLMEEATLADVAVATGIRGLDCAPASLDLAGAEVELAGVGARERRLASALEGLQDAYDLILVDCPPSLGLLTLNALAAAQDLIVPVQCEYYALEGLGQLLATAERVRRSLNPLLRVAGLLLTMYDARTKLASQVVDEVRAHFGDLVFDTVIPRSVRLSEAPSYGEPVVTLDPSSRGSVAYRLLAAEVEARYGLEPHRPPPPTPATEVSPSRVPAPVRPPAGSPTSERRAAAREHRGYGTVAPEPPHLDDAWPPRDPWTEVS